MKHIFFPTAALAAVLALGACTEMAQTARAPEPIAQPAAAAPVAPRPRLGTTAQTAAQFDRTTHAERAAAAAPVSGGQALGTAVVSLGTPSEGGFWLRTPLVSTPTPGRVVTADGRSANVELIPESDTGGRLSLATYQLLGLPLTSLPEVQVFTR